MANILFIVLAIMPIFLFSQDKFLKIEGTVYNQNHEGVEYASLKNENFARSTTADARGNFVFYVKENSIVEVIHVGYERKKITITQSGHYNIVLEKSIRKNLVDLEIDFDKIKANQVYELPEALKNRIFGIVQIDAVFKGNLKDTLQKKLDNYLTSNPNVKLNSGDFEIQFDVSTAGSLENLFITKGISAEVDSILKTIFLTTSNKWIPANQNGSAVPISQSLFISINGDSNVKVEVIKEEKIINQNHQKVAENNVKDIYKPIFKMDTSAIPLDDKSKKIKSILKDYYFEKIFGQEFSKVLIKPEIPGFDEIASIEIKKFINATFYKAVEKKLYMYYSNEDLDYLILQQKKKGKLGVEFLNNICLQQFFWKMAYLNQEERKPAQ